MTRNADILHLLNASVSLPDRKILHDIHMVLGEGEFCYIRGRSGSGKSVLLESLYGLHPIQGNIVSVLGQEIPEIDNRRALALFRRRVGFISQRYNLLDDCSVFQNLDQILIGIEWSVASDREMRIHEVLSQAGLAEYHNEDVSRLSTGQLLKLKMCRAVLNKPTLILADAPTAGLDGQSVEEVVDLLINLASENRSSVLWATASDYIPERYPAISFLCADGTITEMT